MLNSKPDSPFQGTDHPSRHAVDQQLQLLGIGCLRLFFGNENPETSLRLQQSTKASCSLIS